MTAAAAQSKNTSSFGEVFFCHVYHKVVIILTCTHLLLADAYEVSFAKAKLGRCLRSKFC
jgi:hypothetical protein